MKQVAFLIAEDIRLEMGGKVSLMGIMNDKIVLSPTFGQTFKWPIQMKLGVFSRFLVEPGDEKADEISCELRLEEKVVAAFRGKLKLESGKKLLNLQLTFGNVSIAKPGVISFVFSAYAGGKEISKIEAPHGLEISLDEKIIASHSMA